jgi:hypothetical protein
MWYLSLDTLQALAPEKKNLKKNGKEEMAVIR